MNRGRFSAQGPENFRGGHEIEKSSAWTTDEVIYKQTGHGHIDNVVADLTRVEFESRNIAIDKARNFINMAPVGGYVTFTVIKKTFNNSKQYRAVRFDVDFFEGTAFVDDLENEE